MGLLSYLRGDDLLSRDETRAIKPEAGEVPLSGSALPQIWSGPSFWPLRPVDALAIADVWSAVRVLCDAASSLPLHVFRRAERGRQRVTSGRLVELIDRPSPGISEADLVSTLMCHVLIWGNAFLAKYRQQGEVAQLGLLDPDRTRPEIINGELRYRYDPPRALSSSSPSLMWSTSRA
jgi:phage portal protein BeeE